MTRRGILLAYKILAPLALLLANIGLLDELGIIELSERALPEPLFGIAASLMYLIGFSIPVFLILCPIIAVRFRRDLPVMLPALLLLLALLTLFAPLVAGIEDSGFGWPGALLLVASIIAAIWAGYFSSSEPAKS